MKLWRPPKSWYLSQPFGANANGSYAADGMIGHPADDWATSYDTPVPALCDGIVSLILNKDNPDLNKYRAVVLVYKLGDEIKEVTYGHLNQIFVTLGQPIVSGNILGTMGNTGTVYSGDRLVTLAEKLAGSKVGTHTHLQVRPVKPVGNLYLPIDPNNGFKGCIKPEYLPYSIDDKDKVVVILQQMLSLLTSFFKSRN